MIEGKFKSAHNKSEHVAKLMANTFYSLLAIADLDGQVPNVAAPATEKIEMEPPKVSPPPAGAVQNQPLVSLKGTTTLHYNIQIHLPATKDIEVYNSIFRSLKEHLLE